MMPDHPGEEHGHLPLNHAAMRALDWARGYAARTPGSIPSDDTLNRVAHSLVVKFTADELEQGRIQVARGFEVQAIRAPRFTIDLLRRAETMRRERDG